jgi:hypothetical protein
LWLQLPQQGRATAEGINAHWGHLLLFGFKACIWTCI